MGGITLGSLLFYGGITGVILTLIAAIITTAILKKSRKKIVSKLNAEYGGNLK